MPDEPTINPIHHAAGWSGFGFFLLLAAATPLVVVPPSIFGYFPASSAVIIAKDAFIRFACLGLFVAGAVALLGPAGRDLGSARLPLGLLGAYLVAKLLSAAGSASPGYSFDQAATGLLLGLAAAHAPLFVTTPRRARLVLGAAGAGALAVGSIALASTAGFKGINRFIYNADPRDLSDAGMGMMLEGGTARAVTNATLGNPEYVGTFVAAGVLLFGCWVLDGWGTGRQKKLVWWLGGLAAMGLLALALFATGTRGGWNVIAAGLAARWLMVTRVPGWAVAGGIAAAVAGALVGGLPAVFGLVLAGLLAAAVYEHMGGRLSPAWSRLQWRTRALLLASPALFLIALVAFSTAGPWNPANMRVAQRFQEALSMRDNSLQTRVLFGMIAADLSLQSPVLGLGPGLYGANYYPAMERLMEADERGFVERLHLGQPSRIAAQAHNDFFQMTAEQGFVGIGLFLALMVATITGLRRIVHRGDGGARGAATCVATALLGYLAMMMTSFPLHEPGRNAAFHGLLGLALAAIAWGTESPRAEGASRAPSGHTGNGAGECPADDPRKPE